MFFVFPEKLILLDIKYFVNVKENVPHSMPYLRSNTYENILINLLLINYRVPLCTQKNKNRKK